MALEHKLSLRLSQKLILTPQLQLAIRLLQMPLLELSQTLEQELVENPFLEDVQEENTDEELAGEERETADIDSELPGDDAESPLEKMMSGSADFNVDEYFDALFYKPSAPCPLF